MRAQIRRTLKWSVLLAGIMLFGTGLAKVVSAFGDEKILSEPDPIFSARYANLFIITGVLELAGSLYCIFGKQFAVKAAVVLWFGFSFVTYRIGLWSIDYHKPCNCLGGIGHKLGLSDVTLDYLLKGVAVYLLLTGILGALIKNLSSSQTQDGGPQLPINE